MRLSTTLPALFLCGVLAPAADADGRSSNAWRTPAWQAGDIMRANDGHSGHRGGSSAFAGITLDQAVTMVEQRFGAKVVRADTEQGEGRTTYVLRLLNAAGRVWTVRIDASTGSIQE
ncbi:MAG: PepSY domain-containing protein [Steroidobacteraceae bacterium]